MAVPTWTCRAPGPEGEFLRAAGLDDRWVTSSGYMDCVSAGGKRLGRRPSEEVLDAFRELPESERNPGAVHVPDLEPSRRLIPSPPANGLVLRVHARFLSRENGRLRYIKGTDFPLMADDPERMRAWELFLHPNTESMWLTEGEWKSLVPEEPAEGQRVAVDPAIAVRMARFHLTPRRAVTSEGGIVPVRDVRTAELRLAVEDVTADRVRMTLSGFVHTGTEYDPAGATTPNGALGFGYETPIHGILEYDRNGKAFVRFDVIAPGEVWGRWGDANNKSLPVERPGREPFAFAFELATGGSPTDRIPPGGNGRYVAEGTGYFSE